MAAPPSRAPPSTASTPVRASATTPSINYTYSNFFNVPYGEWWDMRSNAGYGDEPVGASCFNQTSVNDGTCTANVAGIPRVAQFPYENWLGPSGTAAIYAPYRTKITASAIPGYNVSQPVFLPVLNWGAQAGSTLNFDWSMQYLDKVNLTLVTTTRGCYGGTGATADEGYQLWSKIRLTLDNQEAAHLFGATVSTTASTIQSWWNTNTLAGCSGSKSQSGALETAVNNWFTNTANNKYDIYNGYAGSYISLYTNITATVVSGGATGLTNVYIEHGAWGTEAFLDRLFYWGNGTYAGNQADSSKAKGWWGMENGWWENLHYKGVLSPTALAFNLTGALQYHFQERSLPGPDNAFRSSTNPTDSDDIPEWTWGPELLDYVATKPATPYSEITRYTGLGYIKTTPGSGDYGTNTSFDYVPISWAAKTGESWYFVFPTTRAAYYQNPATATLGTTLPGTQLPSVTSTLSLNKIFPAPGYGTWNAAGGWWYVAGGASETWPPGTPTGGYPYIPYPGIYFAPASLPPVVTTSAASAIMTTTATLNGNLASRGSASSVTVGFLWGTSPSLSGATNVTVGSRTTTGTFSQGVTGLSPTTTYYFQAWANGVGFATGSILSFTTATPAVPPTVSTVAASGITTTAATLNGALTALGTATSVTEGFLWGTSPTLTGATNVTVGTVAATGTFSHGLTGLTASTTYYFEAWGNGQGFGTGSIVSFTTSTASATAPAVTTNAASAITTTTATLNGATTSLGTASTVTVGFYWGTSATLAGATNVTAGTQVAIGSFNSALTGLSPFVTYYFEAWANGNGFTTGAILSFRTSFTPPSVTTTAASTIATTTASLNGDLTSLGTATSVTVGFLWGTSATLVGATNVTVGPQTATGAFTDALTGLTPGTAYYFEAWANGHGFTSGSILSFTTTVTPPTVVTDPAGAIATTAAYLYGHTTSLGTAATVTVGFLWGTSATLAGATNDTIGTQTATASYIDTLTGLSPGTTYYFEAWANGDGFTTGVILSFTTAVTPPSVSTNAASGITTSGATLNGATSSLGTATSMTVGFLWGTSATLTGATNVTVTTQTAVGAFTTGLSSLAAGTTYYFEAWADGQGFATGTILSFSTTGTAPTPPSVATNAASGISTATATLNGATSSLGTATTVGVGFYWGTAANLAGATNVTAGSQTATGAFTASASGLSPGTTYYFRAWASGDGFAAGTILSFTTTAAAAAPTVTTSAASGITDTAATLNGNLGALGSASSVTVGFLWGTDANLVGATNVTVGTQTSAGAFLKALTGLTAGTTYYFEAWANGAGFAHGTIVTFTTTTTSSQTTFLGMPTLLGYAIVAAIILIAIVAVIAVVLMRRRKGQAPPESPPPMNP